MMCLKRMKIHVCLVISLPHLVRMIEKLRIDRDKLVIAAPEFRGTPPAAALAHAFDVPQVYIRKPGKIPGGIYKSEEYKTAYSKDKLEMSETSDIKGRLVVLIDDGISTGGTTVTCCEMIEKAGGTVVGIFALINHTYKRKN